MTKSLKQRFYIEYSHFKKLKSSAKALLLSYTIYLMTWPLFGTFINTFLWRQSEDVITLIVYNAGFFVGLPLGFIANGFLARHIRLKKLYIISLLGHAIAPLLTIFFTPDSHIHLGINGCLFGLMSGIFWANKNFITLAITKGTNRLYYTNLEVVFDIAVNTFIPMLMGWFIFLSGAGQDSYKVLGGLAGLLLLIAAYLSTKIVFPPMSFTTIIPQKISPRWRVNRLIQIVYWSYEGLNFFLPTALIMFVSNSEGIVGSFDSVIAVITTSIAYFIGRKLSNTNMPKLFILGTVLLTVGAFGLTLHLSLITILLYSLVSSLGYVLRWNPLYAYLMDIIDEEPTDNYSLIVDNEIFFNIGRMIAVLVILIGLFLTNLETVIRIVPLGLAILQFATLPLIKKLQKQI